MVCNLEAIIVQVPPWNKWFQITGKREQSSCFQPEAHIHTLHATESSLPRCWSSSLPTEHHWEIQTPWKYVFLCYSSFHASVMQTESWQTVVVLRYMHIHTLVQLAEMFRREELTYIARGALKKKGIFLQFFQKLCCWKGRKATVKHAYEPSNINPLISASKVNPRI